MVTKNILLIAPITLTLTGCFGIPGAYAPYATSASMQTQTTSAPVASEPAAVEEAKPIDLSPPAGVADLRPVLGESALVPLAFSSLTTSSSPADVAKLFPGADKLDSTNNSTSNAKSLANVEKVGFEFRNGKLVGFSLYFPRASSTQDFEQYMLRVCDARYGKRDDTGAIKQWSWQPRGLTGGVKFSNFGSGARLRIIL